MSLPWWEFVVRGLAVYIFLLIALRVTGKRQIGQLSPFDFILLLILSNAVQNSMNGGDNSLSGGLIVATALIGMNWLIGYVTYKYRGVENFLEGRPEVFIHDGKLFKKVLQREQISHAELEALLRKNGCMKIEDVQYGVIESNGAINIIKK